MQSEEYGYPLVNPFFSTGMTPWILSSPGFASLILAAQLVLKSAFLLFCWAAVFLRHYKFIISDVQWFKSCQIVFSALPWPHLPPACHCEAPTKRWRNFSWARLEPCGWRFPKSPARSSSRWSGQGVAEQYRGARDLSELYIELSWIIIHFIPSCI